jgi:DNA-binding response OmpR family regulator
MTAMLIDDTPLDPGDEMRPRVLVFAADLRLAAFLTRSLVEAGYRVDHAADAPNGLAAFDASSPDLVVLDLVQAAFDGLALTRHLRAHSGVPIIMLGDRGNVDERIAGLDAGADDYLE